MSRSPYRGPIIAVVACVLTLTLMQTVAYSNRTFLKGAPAAITAQTSKQAYDTLRSAGQRGRTAVLLDDTSHVVEFLTIRDSIMSLRSAPGTVPVTTGNLMSTLIEAGVFRQVQVIVSDDKWAEFESKLSGSSQTMRVADGYLRRLQGAPLHFTPAGKASLPTEPYILVVYSDSIDKYDPSFLQRARAGADVTVVIESRGVSR